MSEKLTAGRIASDAPRCCTESDQHIFTRGRSGDSAFLTTAAIHDLSLPIPFERAILPRNYRKSGGNVGQGAVTEAQYASQGAPGHLSMPIAINLGQAPNRVSI